VAGSWSHYLAVDRTRRSPDRARPNGDRRRRENPSPPIVATRSQVHAHRTCRLRAHLSQRATGAHGHRKARSPEVDLATVAPASASLGSTLPWAPPSSRGAPLREQGLAGSRARPERLSSVWHLCPYPAGYPQRPAERSCSWLAPGGPGWSPPPSALPSPSPFRLSFRHLPTHRIHNISLAIDVGGLWSFTPLV
jgi:hypothetical protein